MSETVEAALATASQMTTERNEWRERALTAEAQVALLRAALGEIRGDITKARAILAAHDCVSAGTALALPEGERE